MYVCMYGSPLVVWPRLRSSYLGGWVNEQLRQDDANGVIIEQVVGVAKTEGLESHT